ncbi:MAG TPA: RNA polymerase sigma factor [Thermoanaerobaculia bacterium]|jgi:RNA polymerase sigma-70 factor (ECF subfamily)|nr:RNA polymerase sigma factor [Thermoanaerobaculia bacterium]
MAESDRDDEIEAKFQSLLASYGALLRRTIDRLCPRRLGLAVDDVEQEARLKIWRALQSERELTRPSSFLYKVAMNATLDAIRQVKARREEAWTSGGEETGERAFPREDHLAADPEESPLRRAERRELGRKVQEALGRVAESRRRAVALHLQGFTNEETAKLLGFTEPKARNLIYRGLEDLRAELRAMGIDDETDA